MDGSINKPKSAPSGDAEKAAVLQQTKQALAKMKERIEANRDVLKENPERFNFDEALNIIRKESGLDSVRWRLIEKDVRNQLITHVALQTGSGPTLQNRQKSAQQAAEKNPSKFAKLKGKVVAFFEKNFGKDAPSIVGMIVASLGSTSMIGKVLSSWFNLAKKTKQKTDKLNKKPKKNAAQAPAKAPEALAAADQKLVDLMKKNFTLNDVKSKDDLAKLKTLKDGAGNAVDLKNLIEKAGQPGSRLDQFKKLITKTTGKEGFKFRMGDLMFESANFKETQFKRMLEIIENKDGAYDTKKIDKTPTKIRTFIDLVNTKETSKEIQKVLDSYKK